MAMSSKEKQRKTQERRRNKYLREIGDIPLCACGCGEEVKIKAKNYAPKVIKGHNFPDGLIDRKLFIEKVTHYRNAHNFSLLDISYITGVPRNRISAILFSKSLKKITPETAESLLAPLIFVNIFIPSLTGDLFPKMSCSEGSKKRWDNPEDMVDFEPIRQEMLKLKEELNTEWTRLGEYFDMHPGILSRKFLNPDHKWILKEGASKYRKEFGKIRSLSADAKREKFAPKSRLNVRYESRDRFRVILNEFKVSSGLKTWKEVGEEININPTRLTCLMRDNAKNMRRSVYDEIMGALDEAVKKREMRRNQIIYNLNNTYGIQEKSNVS